MLAPVGSSPVKVALVMFSEVEAMKSSAASISNLPGLSTREAAAIRPSGAPVVNENASPGAAIARVEVIPAAKRTIKVSFFIGVLVLVTGETLANSLPYSLLALVLLSARIAKQA